MTEAQQFSEVLARAASKWPTVIRHTAPNFHGLDKLRKENRADGSLPIYEEVVIPEGYRVAWVMLWGPRLLRMTLHATV